MLSKRDQYLFLTRTALNHLPPYPFKICRSSCVEPRITHYSLYIGDIKHSPMFLVHNEYNVIVTLYKRITNNLHEKWLAMGESFNELQCLRGIIQWKIGTIRWIRKHISYQL